MQQHRPLPDVTVLSDHAEVPGLGFLPVNTFVVHAAEPVVVDTGLSTPGKDFVAELASVIDPADVRWIWITHPDRDHTGGLWSLLEAAPQAKLVTTFLGVGIMSCEWEVPMHRVHLLNPGQRLDVGDRQLVALRPPLFDSPSTTGFYDDRSGALFSSDCFGGPMPSPEVAESGDARAAGDTLRDTQLLWASVDSPWVHHVDEAAYRATVDPLRALDPSAILSTHLPPAVGMNGQLLDTAAAAPSVPPFVGPDQQALEALLATFEPA
ncbi:MBL fold metallo-hydrolase [Nocardioides sp.]|uniref:MBL fold metallo-hydrolase n=1 Tax=Nocardioides sp. TaxID=35761 RepID=UPI002735DFFF|nr:MBL fold metallo-hydrolase [Nocardioides sp.]MDP3892376.1 MBL fold metallo-hydrolase [Nocardioides sp.]